MLLLFLVTKDGHEEDDQDTTVPSSVPPAAAPVAPPAPAISTAANTTSAATPSDGVAESIDVVVKSPARPTVERSSGGRVGDLEIEISELRRKLERAETKLVRFIAYVVDSS